MADRITPATASADLRRSVETLVQYLENAPGLLALAESNAAYLTSLGYLREPSSPFESAQSDLAGLRSEIKGVIDTAQTILRGLDDGSYTPEQDEPRTQAEFDAELKGGAE